MYRAIRGVILSCKLFFLAGDGLVCGCYQIYSESSFFFLALWQELVSSMVVIKFTQRMQRLFVMLGL